MASETWASLESAADPQGGPFTEEETGLMRRLCDDMAAADLAAVGGCKVKRFVRSHGLTNHKTTEKRYAATLKSLGEHVEWRRRVHLEDFLKPETETGARALETTRRWRELWGSEVYGLSEAGAPVMYHHMGGLKPDDMLEEYPGDTMEDGLILDLELLERLNEELSRQVGKQVNLGVAVIDLRDIGMDLMAPRLLSKIKLMIDLPSNHYPESLTHMYIVNAPLAFRGFWRLVLPFIPEENKRKISLLGTDQKALAEVFRREGIDTRRFPSETGGEVAPGASPALGWLGAAFQRARATGRYLWEGVDLESPSDTYSAPDAAATSEHITLADESATVDEAPAATISQAVVDKAAPAEAGHRQARGALSESAEAQSSRQQQKERRRRQQQQQQQQTQRRRRSPGDRGSQQGRLPSTGSAVAPRSGRDRGRFSCCAAPQGDASVQRRTKAGHGTLADTVPPARRPVQATVAGNERQQQKQPPAGVEFSAGDDPGIPTTVATSAQAVDAAPSALPAGGVGASGSLGTWCMSSAGSNAPNPDILPPRSPRVPRSPRSPRAGAGASASASATLASSSGGAVSAYWSSVQSSLQDALSTSGASRYWTTAEHVTANGAVPAGMAKIHMDLDMTPSDESHDGSGGDDSPAYHTPRETPRETNERTGSHYPAVAVRS